jgi:hypothetical protein
MPRGVSPARLHHPSFDDPRSRAVAEAAQAPTIDRDRFARERGNDLAIMAAPSGGAARVVTEPRPPFAIPRDWTSAKRFLLPLWLCLKVVAGE